MNMWEAIVVIVLVVSFAKVLRARFYADAGLIRDRPRINKWGDAVPIASGDSGQEAEALHREIADLRERVKVLERIATDGARPDALAAEIEKLR